MADPWISRRFHSGEGGGAAVLQKDVNVKTKNRDSWCMAAASGSAPAPDPPMQRLCNDELYRHNCHYCRVCPWYIVSVIF